MVSFFKTLFIPLVFLALQAQAQNGITRKELMNVKIPERKISKLKAVEIVFRPGQKAPYHRHPCPVAGFIVEGTCLLQVEGKATQILRAGDTFFEPSDSPILHFDNYSDTATLKFVAYYLINHEEILTEFLPEKY